MHFGGDGGGGGGPMHFGGGGGGGGGPMHFGGGGGGSVPSVGAWGSSAPPSLASQLEQLLGHGGGGNFPLSSLSALYASGIGGGGGGGGGEFASMYGGGGSHSMGLNSHLDDDQPMMSFRGSLLLDRRQVRSNR